MPKFREKFNIDKKVFHCGAKPQVRVMSHEPVDITRRYQKTDLLSIFSSRSSIAALTAAITNAEKLQSFPQITFSVLSIKSLGKRMVLLVVGGTVGILNFDIAHLAIRLYCL